MKNVISIFGVLLALLFVMPAHGGTLQSELNNEFQLNQGSPNALATAQLGSLSVRAQTRIIHLIYDVSKSGGAVASVSLKTALGAVATLPSQAVILNCMIDVQTPFVGAGASIALSTGQNAADLKAATAVTSFASAAILPCIPVDTAATAIKLTADQLPTVTVSGAALTAGKLSVIVQYALDDK